ncbi:MAG TPA: guanosine monophosphate reductase [Nitrososphaerales archaeon]|nr:guanosine monophosphate reductase [Nitrososphaerales archaeon]
MPKDFLSRIESAPSVFTFRDLMLLPGRSEAEPNQIDLSGKVTRNIRVKLPMVSSPMDTVTEWRMALAMAKVGGAGVIHRNMSADDQVSQVKAVKSSPTRVASTDPKGRPLVGAAVSPLDQPRCLALDRIADFLVADVAHFHNSKLVSASRKLLPELSSDFVVGSVGTRRAVEEILRELPRVDGFRAGIGSGSVCTTSEVTRVGAPTLFAVAQVASAVAATKIPVPVIADGGIRGPGDAALALAAGASSVMLGSMLAGTDESPSKLVKIHGRKMKVHRGMASAAARKVRFALDRYSVPAKGLDEGVEAYVPYAGKLPDVIARMENGLRASLGYAGATNIRDLWRVATFGLVSPLGAAELGAHSLIPK